MVEDSVGFEETSAVAVVVVVGAEDFFDVGTVLDFVEHFIESEIFVVVSLSQV